MLAALGVVFLAIGALIEVLDISMAVIASICVIIAVIEYSKGASWMVFGVTSLIAFIIVPSKLPVIFYALFFGFYPILKEFLERRNKIICWILKELIFNVCLAIILVIYFMLFFQNNLKIQIDFHWLVVSVIALCEIVFIIYDIALSKMISFYIFNIRRRLRFKFK